MVTREHILAEIKRTAEANGGVALGKDRFFKETGIRTPDWLGKCWARWSDAVEEAGCTASGWNEALDDDFVLERLASLAREVGHFPVKTEMQIKARREPGFPSHNVFYWLGKKHELAAKLRKFAATRGDDDIVKMCSEVEAPTAKAQNDASDHIDDVEFGFVYLLKSGRFHKIGRTNFVGRRERELAIQLPEKATMVHEIKTDDPVGIERYWHRRFQDRHKNGEWFELSRADVMAFRRRKFM